MKWKLVLASVFAALGVFFVARTFWPAPLPHQPVVETPEPPKSDKAQALLAGSFDTQPTPETVERDIGRATDRVRAHVQAARSPSLIGARQTDLPAAFEERLQALIDRDFVRDARARTARGQPGQNFEPDQETLEKAAGWDEHYGLLPMDIQNLEVREVFRDGVYVAASPSEEGYGWGESRLGGETAFPLADADPAEDRLDIVEVRLPMHFPAPKGKDAIERSRRLIGFQFVWSRERKQWIPWKNVQYSADGGGSMYIPF